MLRPKWEHTKAKPLPALGEYPAPLVDDNDDDDDDDSDNENESQSTQESDDAPILAGAISSDYDASYSMLNELAQNTITAQHLQNLTGFDDLSGERVR